jgi:hypothetical protein
VPEPRSASARAFRGTHSAHAQEVLTFQETNFAGCVVFRQSP